MDDKAGAASGSSTISVTVESMTSLDASGCASGVSYADTVLADSPVGYWRLGDSGATAVDITTSANHGTYVDGPVRSGGAVASDSDMARTFDGAGDMVEVGDVHDFNGTAPFSVEAWMKRTADATTWSRLVSKEKITAPREGWLIALAPTSAPESQRIFFGRHAGGSSDNVYSSTVTQAGRWHHVVVTYDSSTIRMYVDGTLEASTPSALSQIDRTFPLRFAQISEGTFADFNGALDEVAIYDSALPPARVAAHYAAATAGTNHDLATILPAQTAVSPDDCTLWFGSNNDTAMLRLYQRDGGGNAMTPQPASGLIGHWPLNGDLTDLVAGNDMTLSPPPDQPVTASGHTGLGSALQFDGSDMAEVPYSPAYDLQEYTIDLWFSTTDSSSPGVRTFLDKPSPGMPFTRTFGMWLDGSQVCGGLVDADMTHANLCTPAGALLDGSWHHVALTAKDGELRLYVDGVQRNVRSYAEPIQANTGGIHVGQVGATKYFQGSLDEIRVQGTARAASTIYTYYAGAIANYRNLDDGGDTDWATGANMFGACLRSLTGSGPAAAWSIDANGDCTASDSDPWYPIAAGAASAGAKVAATATPGTAATAHLRFGARSSGNQPPGSYRAEITVEVVAPNI